MILGRTIDGPVYVFEKPPRILVVDDDAILRELAASQLAMPGGTIVTTNDGEEGWTALNEQGPFDLVLTDLEMPVLNGFGLVERIRADRRFEGLPIMVITSREDMFAIDRAYEVGATSFVTKPVNWRLLGYQLRYILRGSRLEAEMRHARDEAARAAELKRNLMTLLQHETRTPLHALIGYAEMLRTSPVPSASESDAIDNVVGAARNLNDTLRKIFHFAQITSGTFALDREGINLAHLVAEVVRPLRARAEAAGVALRVGGTEAAIPVVCDVGQLSAALSEVVTNAIGHAPAGSAVDVSVETADAEALIRVKDHGHGLAPTILERCREPFGRDGEPLIRAAGGLGLGLPLVHRIVELHGGSLSVAPDAAGTSLVLRLPLDRETRAAVA
ncbi:MAG TPA: hybrid sensor histidine kinase/response regulator [Beijerinckiaceae bacterium]|jgi:signal transduction histidine kinase